MLQTLLRGIASKQSLLRTIVVEFLCMIYRIVQVFLDAKVVSIVFTKGQNFSPWDAEFCTDLSYMHFLSKSTGKDLFVNHAFSFLS